MHMHTKLPIKRAEISAVVIRCCCGDPASHVNQLCPAGFHEKSRMVAYWNKSRLARLVWRIRQWLH